MTPKQKELQALARQEVDALRAEGVEVPLLVDYCRARAQGYAANAKCLRIRYTHREFPGGCDAFREAYDSNIAACALWNREARGLENRLEVADFMEQRAALVKELAEVNRTIRETNDGLWMLKRNELEDELGSIDEHLFSVYGPRAIDQFMAERQEA